MIRESLTRNSAEFRGLSGSSKIVYKAADNSWELVSLLTDTFNTVLAFYNGSKEVPVGLCHWYFNGICTKSPDKITEVQLKFTKVSKI